jgi:hypothetical protein
MIVTPNAKVLLETIECGERGSDIIDLAEPNVLHVIAMCFANGKFDEARAV